MWFLNLLLAIVSEVLLGFLDFFGDSISNIFETMYKLNKLLNLDDAKYFITDISLLLIPVLYVKSIVGTYILKTEGDYEEDPIESLVRLSKCAAMILSGGFLIEYGIDVASTFTSDLMSTVSTTDKSLTVTFADMITKFMGLGTILATIQCVFTVITVVLYVIFIFKAGKRGAELIFFQLILPFASLDILKANDERWRKFCTDLLVCIFGYSLQLLSYNIFIKIFSQSLSVSGIVENPYALLGSLSWLGFVINGPKWIQKYLHKTGIGDGIRGGTRTALSYIPLMMRK